MAYKTVSMMELVDSERVCLMNRGAPLFMNLKEIHDYFGFGMDDIRRAMSTKQPLISGRYALVDILCAFHGI